MVDRRSRDRLAELIRHLVAGQISSDRFTYEAEDLADTSSDSGVSAVYGFAGGVCPDMSVLWPIRLRGRFRLAPDVRRRMAIAALFLYSDAEYEWPASAGSRGGYLNGLLAFLCGTLVFGGSMLLVLACMFWWCVSAALGCFVAAVLLYRLSRWLTASYQARWVQQQMRFGEYGVWPFLRLEDFAEARGHPRLLCGSTGST
jgi:hypothetical protein